METLEERSLLSVSPLGMPDDFGQLTVNREVYDLDGILVRYGSGAAWMDSAEGSSGARSLGNGLALGKMFSSLPDLRKVEVPEGSDVAATLAAYRADPDVLYAEPDYQVRLAAMPNDPRFDSLWGLNNTGQTGGVADADIDAPEAWDITTGGGSAIVAVIDTGVDYTHPDLAPNMWVNQGEIAGNGMDDDGNGYVDDVYGYDFFNNDADPMDDHSHGTHVSGTIGAAGDDGIGVAGINWNVQIMGLKFLDAQGSGSTSDAIRALDYAVANGATISNNSWGDTEYSQALYDAISAARDAGHIFVTAAGNGNWIGFGLDNDAQPFYPCNYDLDNIVTVAAVDHTDAKAIFSNYGRTTVDLGAPGVGILSTISGGGYGYMDGTSMATPHVTGALALVQDLSPELSYSQVIGTVLSSVDPLPSMDGITVSGGRLNVGSAVLSEAFGPVVVKSLPSGESWNPTDRVRISFSKSVDPSTFTVADIVGFTGPEGEIDVTGVDVVAGSREREFQVTFPRQSMFGDYSLTLGPDILDTAGEAMDQNMNGIAGESVDDRYSAAFSLVPVHLFFDFGTASSPVEEGYIQVLPTTGYKPEAAYGWQSSGVEGTDRVLGTALTRDLNYGTDFTFAVDLPDGNYEVILTAGEEAYYSHDQMGIFLEGTQIDTISSGSWEVLRVKYSGVSVSDGQLNLRIADLGGSDPFAVINGLEIVPDVAGPRVADASPTGDVLGAVDRIALTFGEAVQEGSFTLEDVVSFSGPSGDVPVTAVNRLTATEYEVVFGQQSTVGTYVLTIGPEIYDTTGNALDQNGDGIGGQDPADRFTTQFTLTDSIRFDFGTSGSPVEEGFVEILPNTVYTPELGYGWEAGLVYAVDRGYGTSLDRDLHYSTDFTFVVDVPDGNYEVTLTMGDQGYYRHDEMGVFLEDAQVDTVSTLGREVLTLQYGGVSVSDGQLKLRIADLGGIDVNVVLNGLELAPDLAGPKVVEADPTGNIMGSVDRITLTFDEAIEEGSFTTDDVVALTGPSGQISPTAVNRITARVYEVVFDEQVAPGTYVLTVGPNIFDLTGNAMDQDGDGTGGEAVEDRFATELTLTDSIAFDFGTPGSPVEAGYNRVLTSTVYSPELGYGWESGFVMAVDRYNGTSLTRDMHYGRDFTFAADVPDGSYEVKLTIGDEDRYAHDEMGVFLEGLQVDTLSTNRWEVLTARYSGVNISDGQLNLRIADLGGLDVNAVINGLEIFPDIAGPRVTGVSPTGEVMGPVERIGLIFDEAIEVGSFDVDDVVELHGPLGPIEPAAVNRLTSTEYEIVFAPQSEPGAYGLTIGPDIFDTTGNRMDQDDDGISGEPIEDRYTTGFTLTDSIRFDFGTISSPVADGYFRVSSGTAYTSESRYGWQSGFVMEVDRGSGTDLERDFNYGTDYTFAVDVPDGVYEVLLSAGDKSNYYHDQMGIFLEGAQVDTISTANQEVLTVRYGGVVVSDGQLNVRMADQGGNDAIATIVGLEVSPDVSGPRVADAGPAGEVMGPVDRLTLTFDEAVQDGSFTVADVAQLSGPAGAILPAAVNRLTATEYEVVFDPQTVPGTYALTIGPDILDATGNRMDQDGDGTCGEASEDQFTMQFTLVGSLKFDFGTSSSPVEAGYFQVLTATGYTAESGYGWQSGFLMGADRYTGTSLSRDFHYGRDFTFAADVPDGTYDVTLTVGDESRYVHDEMGVFLEGTQVDTVTTERWEVLTIVYGGVTVGDGRLTLQITDLGGLDGYAVINGLEISPSAGGGSQALSVAGDSIDRAIADLSFHLALRNGRQDARDMLFGSVNDWRGHGTAADSLMLGLLSE